MNPNYIHTITLYRKGQDGAWTRTVLHNCFWRSEITISQNDTKETKINTYAVRIPQKEACAGFKVSSGDLVVHGECQDQITGKSPDTASELLQRNKPDAFKVTAFSDNTSHRLGKHYRLGG